MSVGNNLQISTTETGWILKKTVDGQECSMTIEDKNKNGQLDISKNGDEIIERVGTFTEAEIMAAKKSIWEKSQKNSDKKMTVGDYLNEQKTVEQEEARAEAYERQQQLRRRQQLEYYNQQLDNNGKKNSFWNKAATFLGALCGFGGGFFSNGWQYNSGSFNDWNVRLFSTGVNGLSMTSNILGATYGNQLNASNYMTGGSTNMFGPDFINQMMTAHNEFMENQKSQFEDMMETVNQQQQERKAQDDAKATAQLAEQLSEEYSNANESKIATTNKNKLDAIYSEVKEDSEYTAEEKAILEKIKAYPQIPYDAVDDNGSNENGKFSTKVAKVINELLADYNSYELDEAKANVLSAASHTKLMNLIQKAQQGGITEADLKEIDNIIKEWKQNKSAEEEEE